jgi:hypothetical protein
VRIVLSSNEEDEIQDPKLMNNSTFMKSEVVQAMKALETLSRFAYKGIVK